MPICIVCRKETGEIALLGAKYKDEAPKNMIVGLEPCEDCRKKHLKKGTMLVEIDRKDGKEYITGILTIIKDSAFKRIFNQPIPTGKIAKVEVGLIQKLTGK